MRHLLRTLVICLVVAATVPAAAAQTREPTREPAPASTVQLRCAGFPGAAGPAIACRWTPSAQPAAAGYRLLRASRYHRPAVVFRSAEATAFRDRRVRPGVTYVYAVQVLDRSGAVIEVSNRARAQAPLRRKFGS